MRQQTVKAGIRRGEFSKGLLDWIASGRRALRDWDLMVQTRDSLLERLFCQREQYQSKQKEEVNKKGR